MEKAFLWSLIDEQHLLFLQALHLACYSTEIKLGHSKETSDGQVLNWRRMKVKTFDNGILLLNESLTSGEHHHQISSSYVVHINNLITCMIHGCKSTQYVFQVYVHLQKL